MTWKGWCINLWTSFQATWREYSTVPATHFQRPKHRGGCLRASGLRAGKLFRPKEEEWWEGVLETGDSGNGTWSLWSANCTAWGCGDEEGAEQRKEVVGNLLVSPSSQLFVLFSLQGFVIRSIFTHFQMLDHQGRTGDADFGRSFWVGDYVCVCVRGGSVFYKDELARSVMVTISTGYQETHV